MDGLIAIFAISAVFGVPLLHIWTSHKQKLSKMQVETTAEQTAEKAAQYASQMQALQDRVQVLERIVTDRGYDVATQIEALRDHRERDTRGAQRSDSDIPLDIPHKEKA